MNNKNKQNKTNKCLVWYFIRAALLLPLTMPKKHNIWISIRQLCKCREEGRRTDVRSQDFPFVSYLNWVLEMHRQIKKTTTMKKKKKKTITKKPQKKKNTLQPKKKKKKKNNNDNHPEKSLLCPAKWPGQGSQENRKLLYNSPASAKHQSKKSYTYHQYHQQGPREQSRLPTKFHVQRKHSPKIKNDYTIIR